MEKTDLRLKRLSTLIIGLMCFMLLVTLVTPAVAGLIVAAGGVGIAGSVSEEGVRTASPNLDMEDISKTVTEMLPSRTPLDTILRNIGDSQKAESMIHRYYSVTSKPVVDVPLSSANGAGSGSSVPAKEYTYASGDGLDEFYIAVTNPNMWGVHDTFLMRDITIPATGTITVISGGTNIKKDIAFYVISKESSVLRIMPLNGIKGTTGNAQKYVMPDFTSSTKLYRMGKAMGEFDIQASVYSMVPDDEEQYGQNFISQIEESTFQHLTLKEVNWGWSDLERNNIYDMRAMMEMSFINGVKSKTFNPVDSSLHYTTEGIARRIGTKLEYGTGGTNRSITFADFVDWGKAAFIGNSGSDERILFAGADLLGALHSVETLQKQINGRDPVVKYGLKFNEITLNFGTIYIRHAPLFTASGWGENGMLLDMAHIHKHDFIPMQVTSLDLKKSGQRNSEAKVIQEASFLTLTYPDCHALLGPKA